MNLPAQHSRQQQQNTMLSPGSGKDRRFAGLKDLFNHLNAVGSRCVICEVFNTCSALCLGGQQLCELQFAPHVLQR